MTDPLVLWSTVAGFALPPVLAVVMQARWRPETKGIVAFAACLIAAVGTVWLRGDLGRGEDLTTGFLLVFGGAIGTYRLYWRPTGIAPAIERATDRSRPSPPLVPARSACYAATIGQSVPDPAASTARARQEVPHGPAGPEPSSSAMPDQQS